MHVHGQDSDFDYPELHSVLDEGRARQCGLLEHRLWSVSAPCAQHNLTIICA